jgi:hypothetical protein
MTPHDIPALSVDELQKQARLWIERGAFQYALAFNRAILKSDPKNLEALRFVARATDDIEVADDLWRSAESLEQFSFDDYQNWMVRLYGAAKPVRAAGVARHLAELAAPGSGANALALRVLVNLRELTMC